MCLNFKHSWCLFWHLGWREREKNNTQTITITQKVEPFQMKIRFNQANCWAAFFRAFGPFHSGRGKNTLSTGDPMESSQATVAQGEINQFKGQPTTEHRTQCHLHRKLPETTNLFLWTAVEKTDLFSKGDFYWFASHRRLSLTHFLYDFLDKSFFSCNSKRLCWILKTFGVPTIRRGVFVGIDESDSHHTQN